jgi:hypothetical protein
MMRLDVDQPCHDIVKEPAVFDIPVSSSARLGTPSFFVLDQYDENENRMRGLACLLVAALT